MFHLNIPGMNNSQHMAYVWLLVAVYLFMLHIYFVIVFHFDLLFPFPVPFCFVLFSLILFVNICVFLLFFEI